MSTFPGPDWPYLELRAHLLERDGDQLRYRVTSNELAQLWQCSHKTVSRQLTRLQQKEKISYSAGLGRGNWSALTFHRQIQPELTELTAVLSRQEAAAELARLLRLPFPRTWVLTEEVRRVFGLGETQAGKDRLRTVLTGELTSLEPVLACGTTETHLLAQVLDPLTRFIPETGILEPHLAHHWQVSDDGLTWTFYLRKGVAFHHGRLLDAGDVVFTLNRVLKRAKWVLPATREVTSDHPYRIVIHQDRPDIFLPRRLADTQAMILPRDLPFDEKHPVGTGAFRWTALREGVRLTAFDQYFGERPLIDEVELFHVGPGVDELTLLIAGAEEKHVTQWQEEVGVCFLIWNSSRPAAQNAMLRAALFELYDSETFWRQTLQPGPLLPATSFYPRRSRVRPPRRGDFETARTLYQNSHYDGPPVRLWVGHRPGERQEANWLIKRAASIGLHLEIHSESLDSSADVVMQREVSGPDEHLSFYTALKQPELLFRKLLPPSLLQAVDEELDGYRTAETFAEREAIIDRIEDMLVEGHHVHFTYHRTKKRAVHPLLENVQADSYGRINFKKLWIGGK